MYQCAYGSAAGVLQQLTAEQQCTAPGLLSRCGNGTQPSCVWMQDASAEGALCAVQPTSVEGPAAMQLVPETEAASQEPQVSQLAAQGPLGPAVTGCTHNNLT